MRTPREEAHALAVDLCGCDVEINDGHGYACNAIAGAIENARAEGVVAVAIGLGFGASDNPAESIKLRDAMARLGVSAAAVQAKAAEFLR